MQVFGEHLLPPVQKLVVTIIFFCSYKRKCRSSPPSRTIRSTPNRKIWGAFLYFLPHFHFSQNRSSNKSSNTDLLSAELKSFQQPYHGIRCHLSPTVDAVQVGVHRGRSLAVPKELLNGFDVHAVSQQQASRGVAQIMEPYDGQAVVDKNLFELTGNICRLKGLSIGPHAH